MVDELNPDILYEDYFQRIQLAYSVIGNEYKINKYS